MQFVPHGEKFRFLTEPSLASFIERTGSPLLLRFEPFPRTEAVVNVTEEPSGTILGEGKTPLAVGYRYVSVDEGCRRNEDDGAWRELDEHLEVFEDQVAPEFRIKIASRQDSAPSDCTVLSVRVKFAICRRPEVDGRGRKDGLWEIAGKPVVVLFQGLHIVTIAHVQLRRVERKRVLTEL